MERKIEKSGKGLTLTVKFNQDDVWEMAQKLVKQGKLAPVVHAHWEVITDNKNGDDYICTGCKESVFSAVPYVFKNSLPKHCPNCGAIMDEEVLYNA